jgi:hypothetical protein
VTELAAVPDNVIDGALVGDSEMESVRRGTGGVHVTDTDAVLKRCGARSEREEDELIVTGAEALSVLDRVPLIWRKGVSVLVASGIVNTSDAVRVSL